MREGEVELGRNPPLPDLYRRRYLVVAERQITEMSSVGFYIASHRFWNNRDVLRLILESLTRLFQVYRRL